MTQSAPAAVELPYVTIRYEKPIVHLVFKEDAELGFPEIRELTYYAEKLSGNKPYLVFSDARAKINVTYEGRRVASDANESPLCKGSATLVNNALFQLAVNFFSEFQKPKFPFRVFTDKQKALDWLLRLPV